MPQTASNPALSEPATDLPQGHSFHITLRCNSRAFLIAKRLRRDLMHWVAWYAAMLLNRLSGRCGHFWEARYYATPIAPNDHQRALNTLRYIHANPKAAGVRKGFYDPYSNYGHYARLETDGISDWHPAFLQLSPTLTGCSKRYQRFCKNYRHHPKPPAKCHWGKRLLNNLLSGRGGRSNSNTRRRCHRITPGQQHLPFAADDQHSPIPEDWQHIAQQFCQCNAPRWSDDAGPNSS